MIHAAIVGLSWIGADPAGPPSDPVLGSAEPYSHASALSELPDVTVVAGCDLSATARASFEGLWAQRWPGLVTYEDASAMLEAQRPDLICIATPDHLHVEVAMAAMESGVRMIFCEKPLAIELAAADRFLAMAEHTTTTVNVNYTRRWIPEYVEARARIRAGDIGTLTHVACHQGGPRAMLFRNLTHSLDLLSYYAESDPDWLMAELEPGFENYGTEYRGDGGRDASMEPGVNAHVIFSNGVRGTLLGTKSLPPGESLQLFGSSGRIVIDSEGARLVVGVANIPMVRSLMPRFTRAGMTAAIADLIVSHQRSQTPSSSPQDARRAVALAQAILRSQHEGNVRVKVFPDEGGK